MTIDLDAIQARADAATPGPWEADLDPGAETRGVWPTGPGEEIIIGAYVAADGFDSVQFQHGTDENLEFIAAAREDIPSLVSLVRELQAGIPARVVLGGDPGEIEAALDALPVGSIVESSAEAVADGESRVWSREDNGMGQVAWRGTGGAYPAQSGYLARRCAPLVVISR